MVALKNAIGCRPPETKFFTVKDARGNLKIWLFCNEI